MKNQWKKLSSKIVHKNPWYTVRQDRVIRPDGKKGTYTVVERLPAVFVVALNERKEVYLVGLYRYTTNSYSLEIPGGGSEGESPLRAAKRELKEETGLVAKKWEALGRFQMANGHTNEIGCVFLATGLVQTNESKQKEEGIDLIKAVPISTALEMIRKGKITDGPSIVGLTYAALKMGQV